LNHFERIRAAVGTQHHHNASCRVAHVLPSPSHAVSDLDVCFGEAVQGSATNAGEHFIDWRFQVLLPAMPSIFVRIINFTGAQHEIE